MTEAPASRLGRAVSAVTLASGFGLLALAVLHAATGDGVMVLVWLHAGTAWIYPLALLPLVVAVARRKGKQVVPPVLTLLLWAFFNRPPLGAAPAAETHDSVRFVSSNALMVNPTPAALVDEILALEPDVVAFQEFTPDIRQEMRRTDRFPFRYEHPAHHSFGVGLYSRFPIASERLVEIGGVDWQRAVLDVDGRTVEVWNVHTLPPFTGRNHHAWQLQVATLTAQAARVATPLVVLGDFNLTRHHQGYRDLTGPLTDAYVDCGRWMAWTWPNDGFFFTWTPRIRLDHVFLAGGVRCAAIAEGPGTGSDHRPIVVDVILP